jgi:dienelactone hydrolase
MHPERHDVELTSHGATLRGWLYPAAGGGPGPGIVMAHGLSAVREMFLDRYAEAFAAAGCTVLVYDHFGFGASDGEPRQWPAPSVQL